MSDVNDRIKMVRKQLNLSQSEFGEKLGVTRGVIANIDNNRNESTEPFVRLMCRQFNVDYDWIMTGQGKMFHESADKLQDVINNLLEDENPAARTVFSAFAKFSEEDWKLVQKFIETLKNGAE